MNNCFICGISINNFEGNTIDWNRHIMDEHNLYNYLYYIIYIKNKSFEECDALEKYVKECILNDKTDFFPRKDNIHV